LDPGEQNQSTKKHAETSPITSLFELNDTAKNMFSTERFAATSQLHKGATQYPYILEKIS
jgi:hypothetical protein